jgi:hypothetical protein
VAVLSNAGMRLNQQIKMAVNIANCIRAHHQGL